MEVDMSAQTSARRLGKLATFAVAAAALGALSIPLAPASAQIYLGWDFGHGYGIGIGAPPSAYSACPNYGWPQFMTRCPSYW
jgi:hypothetical protein